MFLHLSVILFSGVCLTQRPAVHCPLGRHPTPWADTSFWQTLPLGRQPPGQTPQADIPLSRHPPWVDTPTWADTLLSGQTPPFGQTHYSLGRHPPLGRHTPEQTPAPLGRHFPWADTPSPLSDNLSPGRHHPSRRPLQRTVRILLECILVSHLMPPHDLLQIINHLVTV